MSDYDHNYDRNEVDEAKWTTLIHAVIILSNFIAFLGCMYLIILILSKRSLRTNTYNLYVVFLLLPDGFNNIITALVCTFMAVGYNDGCVRPGSLDDIHHTQLVFYYFSNFYLNCCVAHELHTMVAQSRRLSRMNPPKIARVLTQVGIVYSLAFLFSLWGYLDVPWSWFDTENGLMGSSEGGTFSQMGAAIMLGSLMMIPITYIIAIRFRIWKKNLLPKRGRTRVLYLYFERIIFIFFGMYLPSCSLIIYLSFLGEDTFWVDSMVAMFAALQALITLYVVSLKQDIREAVVCTCFIRGEVIDDDGGVEVLEDHIDRDKACHSQLSETEDHTSTTNDFDVSSYFMGSVEFPKPNELSEIDDHTPTIVDDSKRFVRSIEPPKQKELFKVDEHTSTTKNDIDISSRSPDDIGV